VRELLEGWGLCAEHRRQLEARVPAAVVDLAGIDAAIITWMPGRLGRLPPGVGVCLVCAHGSGAGSAVNNIVSWLGGITRREAEREAASRARSAGFP
jgi:hypothetical protein